MADLLYADLTYKIRGCAFTVYNKLGFGHMESIYHKALSIEFKNNNIQFTEETPLNITYEGEKVGIYRPDFVIDKKIIIEIKAIEYMNKDSETQMTYYLKGTNFKLGLLINFGSNRIDIRRRIWSGSAKSAKISENHSYSDS